MLLVLYNIISFILTFFPNCLREHALIANFVMFYTSAAEAIHGKAENSLHNYSCIYAEETSLGQPDIEGAVCFGSTSEKLAFCK